MPAGLIVVALLFVDYERRLWQRVAPIMRPVAPRLSGSPSAALHNERSLIVSGLRDACATREGIVNVTQPMHGRNAAGDPFWMAGQAVVPVMPFLKDCKP
ncbi:hypothetical protein [Polaromonas sp.]|nr:hypothetical protein [Polaromonas sp.]HQS31181.1 hypothetical protein [Polaromonas sp.]